MGQDYILDLLGLLDMFLPIKKTMEALQSSKIAPWKVSKFIESLSNHLKEIDFISMKGLNLLKGHYSDVEDMKFKGNSCLVSHNIYFYVP